MEFYNVYLVNIKHSSVGRIVKVFASHYSEAKKIALQQNKGYKLLN